MTDQPVNHNGSIDASDGLNVPRRLILLSLPIIASMVSNTVMHFVDFAMVSYLGTSAMAAVTPASVTLFCFISFGMGMLSMVNTLVSQSLGRRQLSECAAYAWQGVYISLIMGMSVWLLQPLVSPFFRWVGHEPQVMTMEIDYMRIGLIGVMPMLAGVALTNFFTGIHRPSVTMLAAVAGNLMNFLANYLLIFGHFGFPRLGVAGAAWGTVFGALTQMAVLAAFFCSPAYHRLYATWRHFRPSRPRLGRIIWYGLPAGFQHVIEIFAFTIFTLFLIGRQTTGTGDVSYDPVQQAANNLCFRYLHLSFMPTVGLGIALAASVGKAIGRCRPQLARCYTRWAAAFGIAYMGAIGLGYVFFHDPLVEWMSDDPEVHWWATRLLIICAIFQVFDAIGIIYSFALRGAGDNFVPAFMMASLAGSILIGGGFAATIWLPHWQSFGPWIAATLYIILLGLALLYWWQHGNWQKLDLINDQ